MCLFSTYCGIIFVYSLFSVCISFYSIFSVSVSLWCVHILFPLLPHCVVVIIIAWFIWNFVQIVSCASTPRQSPKYSIYVEESHPKKDNMFVLTRDRCVVIVVVVVRNKNENNTHRHTRASITLCLVPMIKIMFRILFVSVILNYGSELAAPPILVTMNAFIWSQWEFLFLFWNSRKERMHLRCVFVIQIEPIFFFVFGFRVWNCGFMSEAPKKAHRMKNKPKKSEQNVIRTSLKWTKSPHGLINYWIYITDFFGLEVSIHLTSMHKHKAFQVISMEFDQIVSVCVCSSQQYLRLHRH